MKQLVLTLASLVAPIVTLFYRKGIWLTPDDPVSPFGCGTTPGASVEPKMQWIYAKFGTFVGDWWWLGIRNSAYGLAYKWKIPELKEREGSNYDGLEMTYTRVGNKRVITLGKYKEVTYFFPFFHVITGYRLAPVWGSMHDRIQIKPFCMDGRPIFSIRFGKNDD